MCIIAFNGKHIGAGVIALIGILLCVITILLKKGIIKSPNDWLYKVTIILSLILIIPYFRIYNANNDAKNFRWNDIVLNNIIPEPESHFGEIISNSKNNLSLYIYKTSPSQYDKYVNACKEKGYTVDSEQLSNSFNAYNAEGYKIKLYYNEYKKEMNINLTSPMQLENIEWPDNEYTKLIPEPESKVGKIEKNDTTGFIAYIGKMSNDDFKNYIKLCADKGFKIDSSEGEKSYTAKNDAQYKINIEYQGNNIVKITMYEPEYEINLEINCSENLILSRYDVKAYVDKYSYQGTIKHGTTETYKITLNRGEHTVNFENIEDSSIKGEAKIKVTKNDTIKLEINCTSSKINVTGGISGEEFTMIDVKGLDAETAKNKLNEIGFINVKVNGDDGNNMVFEDNSKWEIISQSAEAGTQVDKNTEIVLICHKKEEKPVSTSENTTTTKEQTQKETKTETSQKTFSMDDAEDVFCTEIRDSCPYGVKIHSVDGWLAKTDEGNGIYFFKVKVTITNAFKAKYDAVAEGRIDAANGYNITYFNIY